MMKPGIRSLMAILTVALAAAAPGNAHAGGLFGITSLSVVPVDDWRPTCADPLVSRACDQVMEYEGADPRQPSPPRVRTMDVVGVIVDGLTASEIQLNFGKTSAVARRSTSALHPDVRFSSTLAYQGQKLRIRSFDDTLGVSLRSNPNKYGLDGLEMRFGFEVNW